MYSDCALLLQTVLGERGCMDETLHDTALTVPFVYRIIAEHNFYVIYTNSVVKALLHEKDGAFALLARWQATRTAAANHSHSTSSTTSMSTQDVSLVGVEVPPLLPCDALDMYITILGGGTVCELLLRLLIDGEAHRTAQTPGHLLVHPSHITVVTRQPARLARHAQRGVHCLRRHHGRSAVMQSDVVLLACPPALFREVAHDLLSAPASAAEVVRATVAETAAARRASPRGASATPTPAASSTGASPVSILQPNAVLLSCMAGVPARRVAMAFQRTPELTLVAHITPQDGVADDTDGGGGEAGLVSRLRDAPVTPYAASSPLARTALPTRGSLRAVALHYQDVVDDYKTARMADMRCHISFLRPAVLQQQMLASPARDGAVAAIPTNAADTTAATTAGEGGRHVTWSAGEEVQASATNTHTGNAPIAVAAAATWSAMSAPRRTDFTAGRQPATAPSLIAFLDLWRLLKAYVKATFSEALRKARTRVRAAGGNSGGGGNSSGLISVVLPSIPYGPVQVPGEVEAELLPALTLLPASKTLAVWRAWWRGGLSSNTAAPPPPPLPPPSSSSSMTRVVGDAAGPAGRDEATLPAGVSATSVPLLSPRVTAVTGSWLSLVYASDEDLLADLELQYQHVLEGQLVRASG